MPYVFMHTRAGTCIQASICICILMYTYQQVHKPAGPKKEPPKSGAREARKLQFAELAASAARIGLRRKSLAHVHLGSPKDCEDLSAATACLEVGALCCQVGSESPNSQANGPPCQHHCFLLCLQSTVADSTTTLLPTQTFA